MDNHSEIREEDYDHNDKTRSGHNLKNSGS